MNYKKGVLLLLVFLIVFTLAYLVRVRGVGFSEILFSSETQLKFETDFHDFGMLKQNKGVGVYFVYTNKGNSSLKIENIESSCGCTVPKWSKNELKPNGKDSIYVTYDSYKIGDFSKPIYVISNSKTSPDALFIKGVVME